jgi:4a-hydroxytetrahydrobiopterin dehydratase
MYKQSLPMGIVQGNSQLVKGHCVPCEGGTKPLEKHETAKYLTLLKSSWAIIEDTKIEKRFQFKDFKEAMNFVNKIADIAEQEGHHPDIYISYNKVKIELTTHAIGGLSVNDFIMASKIEAVR